MRTLAITGAAGNIGRTLRDGFGAGYRLRLIDVRPMAPPLAHEEVVTADLRDFDATSAAVADADVVVHLAAHATEAPFDVIEQANIRATYNVFEAARRGGARRVIFASSAHVTGFYPAAATVSPSDPLRPDGLYGVSKAFGEALGRMFSDKHGLEVVCVRIGGFGDRPLAPSYLWSWLSPRDAVALFRASVDARDVGHLVIYGVSANTRRLWTDDGWRTIGYEPRDNAEDHAAAFPDTTAYPADWHGAEYTDPAFGRRSSG